MEYNNGLNKNLLSQIIEIIIKRKSVEKIVLFGSRSEERFSESSDIDIAIFSRDWCDKDFNIVKHDLNELIKTPLKIDVLNYYKIDKLSLKKNIKEKGKVIYEFGED